MHSGIRNTLVRWNAKNPSAARRREILPAVFLLTCVLIAGIFISSIDDSFAQEGESYRGALGSGMDIVVELTDSFFDRIIRRQFGEIRACVSTEISGEAIGLAGLTIPVRNVLPVIDRVEFRQRDAGVDLVVRLLAVYGEGQLRLGGPQDQQWTPLNGMTFEFPIGLSAASEGGNATLCLDLSSLPADVLGNLGAGPDGDLRISIPLDFLSQTRDGTVLLEGEVSGEPRLKVVDGGDLAIGLDVELSQDPQWHAHGGGDDGDSGCVLGLCGLPEQPEVDATRFEDQFTESFLRSYWGIAMDAHVVDALLRSVDMNRPGEDSDGCEQSGSRRNMCLKLAGLEDGVIRVSGHGEVFACPTEEIAPDDYYEICLDAGVRLSVTPLVGNQPPAMNARFEIEDVRFCCDDEGWNDWADPMDQLTEEDRSGDLQFGEIGLVFGDPADLTGQLRISGSEIRPEGLVLQGTASVQAPQAPVLDAPDTVVFATGCGGVQGRTFHRALALSDEGGGRLHICPLVIRDVPHQDPDRPFTHADLFTIIRPEELTENGGGLTLFAGDSTSVEVELTAEPGERYVAELLVPTNAGLRTVRLLADLRETTAALETDELSLRRTDYELPCNRGFPRLRPIREGVRVTNQGPGNLQICAIEFPQAPRNADNDPIFGPGRGSYTAFLAAEESTVVPVGFYPRETDVGRTFDGTLRIVTNAGNLDVALTGELNRSSDEQFPGVFGSFEEDMFCGDADYDGIQGNGGMVLDPHAVDELLTFLGGSDCCPPPRGPACLCLDFFQAFFHDFPREGELEILDKAGRAISVNLSGSSPSRTVLAPVKEGNEYALDAKLPKSLPRDWNSSLIVRRWLFRQEGVYSSRQRLEQFIVAGDYAYAVGSSAMEVVSLKQVDKPRVVATVPGLGGATSLAVLGRKFLAAKDGLKVFNLGDPAKPALIANLSLKPGVRTLHVLEAGGLPILLAFTSTQGMNAFDLSDIKQPREIGSAATRVEVNQALEQGNHLFLFGKGGMEVFDLSKPSQPKPVGFLPSKGEVRNALIVGSSAILIYDSRTIDRVDISNPKTPLVRDAWRLENWTEGYVPLAGNIVRHKGRFLMLKGDQTGFRAWRVRPNAVDQEMLRKHRSALERRAGQNPKSELPVRAKPSSPSKH